MTSRAEEAHETHSKLNEETKNKALRMLERRDYAKGEMVDKLVLKGRPRSEAEAVADRFEELGLIDDEKFSFTLARHYSGKNFGAARIKAEFVKRRVPREYWDEALESIEDGDESAYAVLCSKMRGKTPDRDTIKRVSDALRRRGFGWESIKSAVERYLSESDTEI